MPSRAELPHYDKYIACLGIGRCVPIVARGCRLLDSSFVCCLVQHENRLRALYQHIAFGAGLHVPAIDDLPGCFLN